MNLKFLNQTTDLTDNKDCKLEYPTIRTWRRCNEHLRKIMILKEEFWRINNKEFYHIKCKDIVMFIK